MKVLIMSVWNGSKFIASRMVQVAREIRDTLGTRGFSRAQRDDFSTEGRTTSGEGARKTSGPECYDLPFPLNFDLFLSDLIQANQIERLQRRSHGLACEQIPDKGVK